MVVRITLFVVAFHAGVWISDFDLPEDHVNAMGLMIGLIAAMTYVPEERRR